MAGHSHSLVGLPSAEHMPSYRCAHSRAAAGRTRQVARGRRRRCRHHHPSLPLAPRSGATSGATRRSSPHLGLGPHSVPRAACSDELADPDTQGDDLLDSTFASRYTAAPMSKSK